MVKPFLKFDNVLPMINDSVYIQADKNLVMHVLEGDRKKLGGIYETAQSVTPHIIFITYITLEV